MHQYGQLHTSPTMTTHALTGYGLDALLLDVIDEARGIRQEKAIQNERIGTSRGRILGVETLAPRPDGAVDVALVVADAPAGASTSQRSSLESLNELETLLASENVADWIAVSEMFLGKPGKGFAFVPKHGSNSYSRESAAALRNLGAGVAEEEEEEAQNG